MKSLNLLLAGLLVVGLASCGGSKSAEGTADSTAKDTVVAAPAAVDTAMKADTAVKADSAKTEVKK
jgi:hypothetical protein